VVVLFFFQVLFLVLISQSNEIDAKSNKPFILYGLITILKWRWYMTLTFKVTTMLHSKDAAKYLTTILKNILQNIAQCYTMLQNSNNFLPKWLNSVLICFYHLLNWSSIFLTHLQFFRFFLTGAWGWSWNWVWGILRDMIS